MLLRERRGPLLFFVLTQRKDNKRKVKANPIPPGVLPCRPLSLLFLQELFGRLLPAGSVPAGFSQQASTCFELLPCNPDVYSPTTRRDLSGCGCYRRWCYSPTVVMQYRPIYGGK